MPVNSADSSTHSSWYQEKNGIPPSFGVTLRYDGTHIITTIGTSRHSPASTRAPRRARAPRRGPAPGSPQQERHHQHCYQPQSDAQHA